MENKNLEEVKKDIERERRENFGLARIASEAEMKEKIKELYKELYEIAIDYCWGGWLKDDEDSCDPGFTKEARELYYRKARELYYRKKAREAVDKDDGWRCYVGGKEIKGEELELYKIIMAVDYYYKRGGLFEGILKIAGEVYGDPGFSRRTIELYREAADKWYEKKKKKDDYQDVKEAIIFGKEIEAEKLYRLYEELYGLYIIAREKGGLRFLTEKIAGEVYGDPGFGIRGRSPYDAVRIKERAKELFQEYKK